MLIPGIGTASCERVLIVLAGRRRGWRCWRR